MKATIIHIEGEGSEAAVRSALDLFSGVSSGALVFPARAAAPSRTTPQASPPKPQASSPTTPITPITASTSSNNILDHCPLSMGELPAFFDRLTDRQLDTAWVACLIDCATRDAGRVDISQLAAACNAVRARYRAATINAAGPADPTPEPSPPSEPEPDAPEQPSGPTKASPADCRPWPKLLDDLLAAIPKVGDQIRLCDFATRSERSTVAYHLKSPNQDERLAWIKGSPGVSARIRRAKP